MKKDSILYVVLFTFAVCAAFVVVLAVANEVTKPLVAANKLFATRSAVLGAFGIPYADAVDASAKYEAQVGELERGNSWTSTIDGVEYVAIESAGPGLWGTIRIILAASPDGERVRGIRVVSQNETPGLGGRIEEPWFLGQFAGELAPGGRIAVKAGAEAAGKPDTDKENGRVDGISGATRTSQSFESIVNKGLAVLKAGGVK